MDSTTNINQLPVNPIVGGQSNISMNSNETLPNNIPPQQTEQIPSASASSSEYDQQTLNRIINDIQLAASSGNTKLPSRDIPQSTNDIMNDPNIQPNYIPEPSSQVATQDQLDYMRNYYSNNDVLNNYNNSINNQSKIDTIYDEFQIPLLLCVIYLLFQLPIIKSKLILYIPSLFNHDFNMNINGHIFMSILFGFVYYIINKYIININIY